MGSAASTGEPQMSERSMKSVKESIIRVSDSKMHLFADEKKRLEFVSYVDSECWVSYVKGMKHLVGVETGNEMDDKDMQLLSNYTTPLNGSELLNKFVSAHQNPTDMSTNKTNCLWSEDKLQLILFNILKRLFLENKGRIIKTQTSGCLTDRSTGEEESVIAEIFVSKVINAVIRTPSKEQEVTEVHQFPNMSPSKKAKKAAYEAAQLISTDEISALVGDKSWMSDLIEAVDDISLCVTLASALPEHRGFPLIYVNKTFERITGYDRNFIVGKNCKFLQCDESEPEQIAQLSEGLRLAKPVRVALTNVRKDGSRFFNLLAMKPVCDAEGRCCFVIGVQYDISQRTATVRDLKRVDDLLSLLPNIIM